MSIEHYLIVKNLMQNIEAHLCYLEAIKDRELFIQITSAYLKEAPNYRSYWRTFGLEKSRSIRCLAEFLTFCKDLNVSSECMFNNGFFSIKKCNEIYQTHISSSFNNKKYYNNFIYLKGRKGDGIEILNRYYNMTKTLGLSLEDFRKESSFKYSPFYNAVNMFNKEHPNKRNVNFIRLSYIGFFLMIFIVFCGIWFENGTFIFKPIKLIETIFTTVGALLYYWAYKFSRNIRVGYALLLLIVIVYFMPPIMTYF